ncbi:MAG: DNA repair protein RadA [Patescibacteria group bacterium]
MSQKIKQIYECSYCGAQSLKWSGRCLECGNWGTMKLQSYTDKEEKKQQAEQTAPAEIFELKNIKQKGPDRMETGIKEVDRVLGGGVVPGSLILLSGDPGIGKSTLTAQIGDGISRRNQKEIFYISGEESAGQVKQRLERLGCDPANIKFISNTNVEKIISSLKDKEPAFLIIDSIQTLYSSDNPSEPGSVSQIRCLASKFMEFAKENNAAVILIGHITKDGQLAGPKTLEHIVDTVLYLESEATQKSYCLLRGTKNRFGSVNEVGVFEMTGNGFQEIANSSSIFLEDGNENISGSVISCVMDGSKSFFVDVQALVTKTVFGYPQRKSSGLDVNRLQVLTSVLTKRTNFNLVNQDIVLNIVGGMKVADPALDLSVCLAIVSSFVDKVIPRSTLVLGEVGLGGEIRNIAKPELRLKEAERLGFDRAIVPKTKQKMSTNMDVKRVRNIKEAVGYL